jgi:hypothetical protein
MRKVFASIGHPAKYGYAYDSSPTYRNNVVVDSHFEQFETYGDGLCQHSGSWSVGTEYIADYFLSLAVAMLAAEDTTLVEEVSYIVGRRPADSSIEFAKSVIFNEHSKTRYYSVDEEKISSSSTKQHDKRYERIEKWHDGSPEAIYRILIKDYSSGIQRFAYASAIRDYLMAGSRTGWMDMPAEFLKWTEDREASRRIRDGYEACRNIAQAHHLRHAAQCHIDNYKRAVERAAETKPEKGHSQIHTPENPCSTGCMGFRPEEVQS